MGSALAVRRWIAFAGAAPMLAAALAGLLSSFEASAARPRGDPPGINEFEDRRNQALVRRIQKALAELGLYRGPVSGVLDDATQNAIRAYERHAGVEITGRISEAIAEQIETAVRVQGLLHRLDEMRKAHADAARDALLSHPATRDLVTGEPKETADPTRDAKPCFREPTARCLLREASESAKAVAKADLRDWALGEVLVSQAKAGLVAEAMDTVRRVSDPRLIMVALRDIAEAQAQAGRTPEAIAATDIIPDTLKRVEAYAAIADIQIRRGDAEGAKAIADRLSVLLDRVDDPLKRVQYRARLAVVLSQAGDAEASQAHLVEAEAIARSDDALKVRSAALRHVASALAELAKPDQALALLGQLPDAADRTSVLISAATAQVRAGDAAAALGTAENIDEIRYRAVVLGRIAVAQAERGDIDAAETTLQLARAGVDKIRFPFARAYAVSRIALALADLGKRSGRSTFERAAAVAETIEDSRLRAHTLWTVGAWQRRAGDPEGAHTTETRAKTATEDIKSPLTQVWMLAEIAAEHMAASDPDAGWAAFNRALAIGETIDNAWSRARALSKLASTLIVLVAPNAPLRPVFQEPIPHQQ